VNAVALLAEETDSPEIGPGLLGFAIMIFLLTALFLLYRSLRKQIRRVDFDAEGETDEERTRGRRDSSD
jgi:hypothetical protein